MAKHRDVHVYNNLIIVGEFGNVIPTLLENELNQLYVSHNVFYDSSRIDLDTDLLNNAFFYDPLIFNSDYYGENNPESYKIQNNSPAVGAGYLINGSLDTTDYIHNNGGFDYFGNHVSHETESNIGAFNGKGSMNILTSKNGDFEFVSKHYQRRN